MQLSGVEISNYRSISNLYVPCGLRPDKSATFGLIGLNEAGKSNTLRAIALLGTSTPLGKKDFHAPDEGAWISFDYDVSEEEGKQIRPLLVNSSHPEREYDLSSGIRIFQSYSKPGISPALEICALREGGDPEETTDWDSIGIAKYPPVVAQKPVFWTASDTYLISKPINLATFAANPVEVSVPLRNCFLLCGITDIPGCVAALGEDSTEIEFLQNTLGRGVTSHIKAVWPNHPIEISFIITSGLIHFHVRDVGGQRAKTADQRSDGFKQFVSFLLTISAQNKNEELSRSILLLDEPETHLHPLAQEYLLSELTKITKNDRGNVVLFATHSNFMIDKQDLGRNFRISKKKDASQIEQFAEKASTYASVTYEVFELATNDYHTELYGSLHERFQDEAPQDEKRAQVKNFDEHFLHKKLQLKKHRPWKGQQNEATLPTYIRNCIHHPDNGGKFTDKELRESIETLRKALL